MIGGGPAGLAAAIAARQRGFDVTLADCSIPPIDKACGEGIMPDGLAAAQSLGIDLDAAGAHPFRGIRFCERGASVEAAFPKGHGLGLRRTTLHRMMVERAAEAGVRMAWGARVTGISGEGVIADGRLVRARWIVGADGGQSPVRRWAGLDACRARQPPLRLPPPLSRRTLERVHGDPLERWLPALHHTGGRRRSVRGPDLARSAPAPG